MNRPAVLASLLICGLYAGLGCSASTAADEPMTAGGGMTAQAGTTAQAGQAAVAGSANAGAGGGQSGAAGASGGAAGSGGTANPAAGSGGAAGASAGAGGAGAAGMAGAAGAGGAVVIPPFTGRLAVIDYSPFRAGQAPGGAQPTEAQVREDLEILKQMADGVRIYGTDGALGYVPALCDELELNLHIGAWIDGLASDAPNVQALADVVNLGHPSIKTAVVGNEVLNRVEDNMLTEEDLIVFVEQARAAITAPVTIAVAETYPRWMEMRPNLAASVDMIIWHTYGWWSGADINAAAALIHSRFQDMLATYPGKPMVLGETGWPSMYDNESDDLTTIAVGSEENQAKYYREVLGILQADGLEAWPFSAFDEPWKATSGEGMVGAYWGIFNVDRTPKLAATELLAIAAAAN